MHDWVRSYLEEMVFPCQLEYARYKRKRDQPNAAGQATDLNYEDAEPTAYHSLPRTDAIVLVLFPTCLEAPEYMTTAILWLISDTMALSCFVACECDESVIITSR
jgi:hypothetical protein